MDQLHAKNILTRYRANNCTEEEQQLVENWVVYGAANPLDLSDSELLEDLLDIRLRLERDLRKETPVKTIALKRWLPYAAAIFMMGTIGIWAVRNHTITHQKNEHVSLPAKDVLPGGNRATLTLANGQAIDLKNNQKEIIVGNKITYADGSPVLNSGSGIQLLTLSTPRGGTYQITLPDGSKVWLNSSSRLTYPSQFAKDERIVELEGEAYFEISKRLKTKASANEKTSKLPFLVKTRNQTVEVLGTQFNISAYSDESNVKTTLVEGSVKVALVNKKSAQGTVPIVLKPGQQSILHNDKTTVNRVDVSTFIGWKQGYFIFNGTELQDAMKQLSRWYNVEIRYEGNLPRTLFYGKISREGTLAEALVILKEGKVNFRIEKQEEINRLIVMP